MIPYIMETLTDCGPRCIRSVTGIDWEKIMEAWPGGWGEDDRGKLGLPNDTPADHFAVLDRLGVSYRVVTCGEILSSPIPQDKIVVLLHGDSVAAQHWAIIQERSPDGVRIHMGNGTVRNFTVAQFQDAYSRGWPACAYIVGEEPQELKWWERILKWLARWI